MTSISIQKKRIRGNRDKKHAVKRAAVAGKKIAKSESTKLLRKLCKKTGITKKG